VSTESSFEQLAEAANQKYFVVNESGRTVIFQEQTDPHLGRVFYDRLRFADFRNLYCNRLVTVDADKRGQNVRKPFGAAWLDWPDRRTYPLGVIFDPSDQPTPEGKFNLWRGFAVDPAEGDWSLLRRHMREVICQGNEEHFAYLMGWCSRMIQRPAEQGEVAVVLQGKEGCGKGILARALVKVFGQHGMQISQGKHLTGNFNQHLRDCICLFADEAFYAGDPSQTGVLKTLITEPEISIEAKYFNAVQTKNFLHIIMASNNEWVVPASIDARRFFVLQVADTKIGDHAYFAAICQQMEDGGHGAMLHDLANYDLAGFNVRAVPETEALQRQKKLSLQCHQRWWMEVLTRGYVFGSKLVY
jgi:hypothetical protein